MIVGVLALQGAFVEHEQMLASLSVATRQVRLPDDLNNLSALIIPGGESTTIGKLAGDYKLIESLKHFCKTKAVWGTCAGMIMLANRLDTGDAWLNAIDIKVQRNAFGSQKDSFIENLKITGVNTEADFPAVFIRAPLIIEYSKDVQILARLNNGTAVAAQQGKILVTAFHPELSGDSRMHSYFLRILQA